MEWLKRLLDYTESKLSNQVGAAEDEKQIGEIVESLKTEIAKANVRIASLSATVHDERERADEILMRANRRHDEAKLAVLHGDDDAARRALAEEQSFRSQYHLAFEEKRKAEETLIELRGRVQMLENQVYGLSNRKDEYLARLATAELAKMTADIKGGIDSRGRVFERLEEKVVRKELEADAHAEVAGRTEVSSTYETDNLVKAEPSVDEMLQKLQTALEEEGPAEK